MNGEIDHGPVSCCLSDAEFRVREQEILARFWAAVMAIEELVDGYAFRIPGDHERLALAAELIAAERQCCPFLTFDLLAQPKMGPIILKITGPAGTKEFLKTIFPC